MSESFKKNLVRENGVPSLAIKSNKLDFVQQQTDFIESWIQGQANIAGN